MGYRIYLSDLDRERLSNLLQLAEHAIELKPKLLVSFTGEDIVLSQKVRKTLTDLNEYIMITG